MKDSHSVFFGNVPVTNSSILVLVLEPAPHSRAKAIIDAFDAFSKPAVRKSICSNERENEILSVQLSCRISLVFVLTGLLKTTFYLIL